MDCVEEQPDAEAGPAAQEERGEEETRNQEWPEGDAFPKRLNSTRLKC